MNNANTRQKLDTRLADIAQGLQNTGSGIALLALGSVGRETSRLDEFSDLDFFAIVQPGTKTQFLEDLSWLETASPIVFAFKNTADGYKALYEDGIFLEMAVFEPAEFAEAVFAPGRIVWQAPGTETLNLEPRAGNQNTAPQHSTDWLVGELTTNIYVGLGRLLRGERLSAQFFIEHYAFDRYVDLFIASRGGARDSRVLPDPFARERRIEAAFPELRTILPELRQGYARVAASADALLKHAAQLATLPEPLVREIRVLLARTENHPNTTTK